MANNQCILVFIILTGQTADLGWDIALTMRNFESKILNDHDLGKCPLSASIYI